MARSGILRRLNRFVRCRRGSAMVEFGFLGPLFIVLITGSIEMGRLAYTQAALYFAAQEATRYAVVNEGVATASQIENFASSQLIGLDQSLAVFTATAPLSNATNTSLVTVSITYPFNFLIPLPSLEQITLSAESRGFYAFPQGSVATP